MTRTLVAVLLLSLCSSMSAQLRLDLGIAAGRQSYEAPRREAQTLISPEVMLSRGRFALYYSLEYTELPYAGTVNASHLGLAYRWMLGRNLALRAGAGPSYVTIARLGGEPTWHAQLELALRRGRLEGFAKVRQYDYSLSEFRTASASPDGPALLAGLRVTLNE